MYCMWQFTFLVLLLTDTLRLLLKHYLSGWFSKSYFNMILWFALTFQYFMTDGNLSMEWDHVCFYRWVQRVELVSSHSLAWYWVRPLEGIVLVNVFGRFLKQIMLFFWILLLTEMWGDDVGHIDPSISWSGPHAAVGGAGISVSVIFVVVSDVIND